MSTFRDYIETDCALELVEEQGEYHWESGRPGAERRVDEQKDPLLYALYIFSRHERLLAVNGRTRRRRCECDTY